MKKQAHTTIPVLSHPQNSPQPIREWRPFVFGWLVLLLPILTILLIILFENHPWVQKQSQHGVDYEAQKHISIGREEMKKGNYRLAFAQFKTANQLRPDDATALTLISQVHYQMKDYQGAISELQKAIDLNPPQIDMLYNNLGLLYANTGNFENAEIMFQRSLQAGMKVTVIQKNLGKLYISMKQYDRAINAFHTAIDAKPTIRSLYVETLKSTINDFYEDPEFQDLMQKAQSLLNSPTLDQDLSRFDAQSFDAYVLQDSKDTEVACLLGSTYILAGKFQVAEEWLNQCIAMDPGYSEAWFQYGLLRKAQKRDREAIDYFAKTLRLNSRHTSAKKAMESLRNPSERPATKDQLGSPSDSTS